MKKDLKIDLPEIQELKKLMHQADELITENQETDSIDDLEKQLQNIKTG